jgi:acylphosphatase
MFADLCEQTHVRANRKIEVNEKRCFRWYDYGFISRLNTNVRPGSLGYAGRIVKRYRMHIYYSGKVQGVGFRYTTKDVATGYEVTGIVRNLADGRVELMAEGAREELEVFQQGIRESGLGRLISNERVTWEEARGEFRGFEITS